MATFTVTTTADSGVGSLRLALANANATSAADTIVFAAAITGQTITLTSGQLSLNEDVTINGDTNNDREADITISGGGLLRVFETSNQNTEADITLRSLTVTNGYAEFQGGAIFFGGKSLNIVDSTISQSNTNGTGGALYADYTTVTISNSLFTGNTALGKGGAITSYGGNTTILNSTIHGNQAGGDGGAIYKNGGYVTLDSMETGHLTIVNSTITSNLSGSGIGGVFAGGDEAISNTVIAGNTGGDVAGTVETANNNAFGGPVTITSGGGNLLNVANTGLGALADNGGPVLTRAILTSGSVLVNAGSNAAASASGLTTDATGGPRVQGNTVDIGAVEAPLILVTTAADVVNAGDGVLSLREAVTLANSNADASTIVFATALAGQTLTLTGGELTLTQDVTIDGDITGDNRADITLSGGGVSRVIFKNGGDAVFTGLTFTDGNGTGTTPGYGGAIYAKYGTTTLINSTIRDSSATLRGGGLYAFYDALTVINSLVSGNTSAGLGGGLALRQSALSLTNSTVVNNTTADFAGGIRLDGPVAAATIINSTVTGNHAATGSANTAAGGGLELVGGATVAFRNSVVADNRSGNGTAEHDFAGSVSASNSVFGTAVTIGGGNGINLTNIANVGLGNLLDNGGPTLTRSPLDGSVLIGAGANALLPLDVLDIDGDGNVTEVLPRDGRGGVRVTGVVDVGAVEQRVNETIGGTAIADTIIGGLGLDTLSGLAGIDILNGGDGDDILIGGAGGDTLIGGPGSDTASYVGAAARVKVALDNSIVFEGDALGDTFNSIARLIGTGSSDILIGDLNGNIINGGSSNDTIRGQAGNDILRGDKGGDNISGGLGDDKFSFLALDQAGDLINDFTNAVGNNDIFNFKGSAFGGLPVGALAANRFVANLTGLATTADHRFIYETDTGILRYDSNGTGAGGVTVIATLTGAPALSIADFAII